ncbi:MAG: PEP/pyruvate-binding domain-containing protein [Thermodesulfobacteriota bacterium]
MLDLVKRWISRKGTGEAYDAQALRIAFKERYHHFKLLLNANNKALATMAEMEEALRGTWPFGMSFVRSRCTGVSTSVFQIARNLNQLAPGKYGALLDRFKEIQQRINPYINPIRLAREGPLVIPFEEVDRTLADLVGSKMANLGEIRKRLAVNVPRGFAVTASAYESFMRQADLETEIDRLIQSSERGSLEQRYALSASIQQKIIGSPVPDEVAKAIVDQYRRLGVEAGKRVTVAMRSSALGEDLPGTSFAGQYRSELNISAENILAAYKEIVASKYSPPAMTYRLNRGIRADEVAMCVICMEMVDAVSGGVAYSRNPLDIRDDAVIINAAWGLPKSVVDGSTACDLFVVARGDPLKIRRREIAVKEQKFTCYPEEGVCRLDVTGPQAGIPSLTDEQVLEVARLAVLLEEHYGTPQDMEWATDEKGAVLLLQCRPLQKRANEIETTRSAGAEGLPGNVLLEGGTTASPGVGAGPVFVVKKDMDALQFPAGAVLVADQALPRWAMLLNRAAAVITGQGGVAGHLANVAREYRVPALFGVKGPLERLQGGMTVTVDADGRRVYEGRREDLLRDQGGPKNLMEGSAVLEALRAAAEHIIPLHLLDPDAPGFRPERCSTFHDITRFCHEKSVHEMFQFGKEHRFPERSSKQLLCDVPMQWWVLNLDDGFREEEAGRYVRLENIVSIPMLAIWEGITAMPWEGPPPVDGKGLMSVMFEATRNTALVPGARSRYGDRNYFMISRNYCSLNSRLGFHFSTIETLVSERAPENYIAFQFKGGAANYERRLRRVLFIQEILEEHGFRADVKEDTLLARIGEGELEYMRERLRILGFITIHTRQLDMIMANSDSLRYYGMKIRQDIRRLTGSPRVQAGSIRPGSAQE